MHRHLITGAAAAAATMAITAGSAFAATTPVPLTFNHVVLDTPATGDAQLVSPSTAPLKVTANVDPTTGDFTIDPSSFSSPAFKFTSPVPGTATLSLATTATGTVDFATGAVTMTGDFVATLNLGSYGSCVIDTGNQTLSTAAKKPLPGKVFGAGATTVATADGAFGVSWSTLPASSDGSSCSIINAAVDGPGGLWISRGISPVPVLALTPVAKATSVKAGKTAIVSATLANTGAAATSAVKVCLAAKSPLKSPACQLVKPAAGSKRKLSFRVATKATTKAGSYKLTLTATGAKSQTVTLKVTG